MTAVMRVRDANGNIIEIQALKDANGKSAYQYAVDGGGYTGTEEEFAEKLASETGGGSLSEDQINALHNMFKVCAYIKGDISTEYNEFLSAFGLTDDSGDSGDSGDTGDSSSEGQE